jgi:hypothetical protein
MANHPSKGCSIRHNAAWPVTHSGLHTFTPGGEPSLDEMFTREGANLGSVASLTSERLGCALSRVRRNSWPANAIG